MYKKFLTAAALLLTAALLSACGADKTPAQGSKPESEVSQRSEAPESIPSDSVKELESSTSPEPDSESTAPDETDTEAGTDSESEEEKTEETAAQSFELGGVTLTAQEIPYDKDIKLSESTSGDAVLLGDTMYLLDGKKLRTFTLGDKLEETGSTALSGSYSRIDADAYGNLYLSRDRFDCAVLGEDGELQPLETAGVLSMSKVMEYGLCANDGKITKYTSGSSDGWSSAAERELSFPGNVSAVEFAGNHVLVAHTDSAGSSVTVCDYDGNTLADTDGGSVGEDITAMTETAGVIAASSCGDLCLWNDGGELIGRLSSDDTAKLFGTDSPVMIKRLIGDDDGSVLAVCTYGDKKTVEPRLFRISGL